ncbi:MAG TPA: lipid-binding SYLF domain-containing protein [Bryobacteraceae bacterium]|nr:lipid-binding SYLF domain-containing protein [Bryobacteraceae bacterium]
MRFASRASGCAVVLALISAVASAQEETPDKRLQDSALAFRQIMAAPDRAIPRYLLARAQCIVIVPGMKKGAFLVGGQYGRGFASCRIPGSWSGPAPVRLAGGSFGLQMGADSVDIILLVMNKRGMERLLSEKFSIGADVTGAAGPVGREAKADTDVQLKAEILSWSRARGLFAGVSLNGTVVEADHAEARKLYGRAWSSREILQGGIGLPDVAKGLSDELARDVYQK